MGGAAVRAILALALLAETGAVLAQPNLRSTFPGRRIGGGTRGECTARVLAHLVPASSVFAPGSSGLIALLEGPTANPRPLLVALREANAAGSSDAASARSQRRQLPASGAGVTLLALPLNGLSTGMFNWASFAEVAFEFRVTAGLLGSGMALPG